MMGGGQPPHNSSMSYNPGQQSMGRYTQGGQPAMSQPPGGAYGSQYQQQQYLVSSFTTFEFVKPPSSGIFTLYQ